jgi:hypothetical protein
MSFFVPNWFLYLFFRIKISTRLFAGSLGDIAVSNGLVSAYPAAVNNEAANWNLFIRYLTTEHALALESSQFEGYCLLFKA